MFQLPCTALKLYNFYFLMIMTEENLTADRKALLINLDPHIYGTLAEIGAGQEVARHFFRVGGAAGSIAKSISAYDMKFSDEIYGKADRYVSRKRLESMLDHEYDLLLQRLASDRGDRTHFFAFANTVAAQSFKGTTDCHGWMGIRFQLSYGASPSDIILHVRMTDKDNLAQQQALGIIGVNLIYGAFFIHDNIDKFIASLLDELSTERIEVDMIELRGASFDKIDNRMCILKLVSHNLTNAAMISPDGRVLQPSEVLYKKPVLVERGSFRPVTWVHVDMLKASESLMRSKLPKGDDEPVILFEITLQSLLADGSCDGGDFLSRVDTLSSLGYRVLISDYPEYYRLAAYLRRYTQAPIGLVVGINNLVRIFDEQFYKNLSGGILESFGRMFLHDVKLYAYPMAREVLKRYLDTFGPQELVSLLPEKDVIDAGSIPMWPHLKHLYKFVLESGFIEAIPDYKTEHAKILGRGVEQLIRDGDASWEEMVPPAARSVIKQRGLFGAKKD